MSAVARSRRGAVTRSVIARSRRRAELGLIVMAVAITGALYTLASLGVTASVPADIGPFLAIIAGLLIVAHIAVRRLAPEADGILLPVAAVLNGIGYVFIARIKPELASRQAGWTAVAVVAFVLTLIFIPRIRDLERYRYTFGLVGFLLLISPLVPGIGSAFRGARIWVEIGPISFQPGEFAKLAFALFFASYLVEKRELLAMATWPRFRPVLPDLKHLGPILFAWGLAILIMTAQRDLGSSLLFFAIFMAILFVAAAYGAWTQFDHVQTRVTQWFNPWQDVGGQLVETWYALAWGGATGTGIGLGRPDKIPVVESDFIFAAIGEELGLLGGTAVLICYLLIVGSGLRVAVQAEDPFEKLLAAGLTALIGIQSFVILAGVLRVLPLTGVVLPFVSYGGSALVANYVLIALLLRISDGNSRRRTSQKAERAERAAKVGTG